MLGELGVDGLWVNAPVWGEFITYLLPWTFNSEMCMKKGWNSPINNLMGL